MNPAGPDPRDVWIEGEFEGIYAGTPRARGGADGGRCVVDLELQSGTLRNARRVPAPAPADTNAAAEIRQERLFHVRLPPGIAGTSDAGPLFDVRIRDFRLLHPATIRGRAYGTIAGRVHARLAPVSEARVDAPAPAGPLAELDPLPPAHAPAREPDPGLEAAAAGRAAPVSDGAADHAHARVLLVLAATLVAAFAWACGVQTALLWAAPLAGVAALRRAGRAWIDAATGPQHWLGAGVIACQAALALPHLESAWHGLCLAASVPALAWAASPLVLAAGLRARGPLQVCAVLWTGVACAACIAASPGCAVRAAAASDAAREASALAANAPDRTDARGRWPAGPGASLAPRLPPAAPGGSGGGQLPGLALPPGGGGGADAEGPIVSPEHDPLASLAPGAAGFPHAALEVPGGWVAPEDPQRQQHLVRISVEHANRDPGAFFDADASRRVYVQTDPIFENGGSRLRARGPLELTRLANLLAARPDVRVVIEVHSDSGGGPREQRARSERRAAVVRDWLATRGRIAPERFEVVGVGGGEPIVPPDGSYAAQQPNRRLEVRRAL